MKEITKSNESITVWSGDIKLKEATAYTRYRNHYGDKRVNPNGNAPIGKAVEDAYMSNKVMKQPLVVIEINAKTYLIKSHNVLFKLIRALERGVEGENPLSYNEYLRLIDKFYLSEVLETYLEDYPNIPLTMFCDYSYGDEEAHKIQYTNTLPFGQHPKRNDWKMTTGYLIEDIYIGTAGHFQYRGRANKLIAKLYDYVKSKDSGYNWCATWKCMNKTDAVQRKEGAWNPMTTQIIKGRSIIEINHLANLRVDILCRTGLRDSIIQPMTTKSFSTSQNTTQTADWKESTIQEMYEHLDMIMDTLTIWEDKNDQQPSIELRIKNQHRLSLDDRYRLEHEATKLFL